MIFKCFYRVILKTKNKELEFYSSPYCICRRISIVKILAWGRLLLILIVIVIRSPKNYRVLGFYRFSAVQNGFT